jgi:YYY domain-containing protein
MSDLVSWRRISRLVVVAMILYVLLLIGFVLRGYWILPVALTLTIAAGLLGLRAGLPVERRVVLILISSALGLTALVEVVVLDGDVGRMNTVFKFYMQVWSMLSIASGVALVWVWPAVTGEWGRNRRRIWKAALALLLLSAALYPLLATRAKWQVRMDQEAPNTLDGMAFMQYASYGDTAADGSPRTIPLRHEYDALRWMQDSIEGSPVIVEAHSGNPYRSIAGRVAMYTGLPTVIGWDWHQRQQRATVPDTLVWNRVNDVKALFDTTDVDQAMRILNKYGVQYVYVGELERTYYQPAGIDKFERMAELGLLQKVYENEGVSIYEVLEQG